MRCRYPMKVTFGGDDIACGMQKSCITLSIAWSRISRRKVLVTGNLRVPVWPWLRGATSSSHIKYWYMMMRIYWPMNVMLCIQAGLRHGDTVNYMATSGQR